MPGISSGKPSAKTTTLPEEWDKAYRKRNPAKGDEDEDLVRRHPELTKGRTVPAYIYEGIIEPAAKGLRSMHRKLFKDTEE
jgi:hypothetical protein